MPRRYNGTGTTISPMPDVGKHSITMYWITVLFIPLIPLGWQLVKGTGYNEYQIIKELTYSEVKNTIGIKGMLLTIGYEFFRQFFKSYIFYGSYACYSLDKVININCCCRIH